MRFKKGKLPREWSCVLVSVGLLAVGGIFGVYGEKEEQIYILERPAWGEGEKEQSLLIENEEGERQEIKVTVSEKVYSKEEIAVFLEKGERYVRQAFLGENTAVDKIEKNLVLLSKIPELPVEVYWDLGEEMYFDRDGTLKLECIPENGAKTKITAVLICQQERSDVEIQLKLLPPVWTKEEIWRQSVEKVVQEKEESEPEAETVKLPALESEQLTGYYEKESSKRKGGEWFLFSLGAGGLFYAALKKEEKEKQEKRRKQLLAEYPVLVEKLLLFMQAGMSVRNIFLKLSNEMKGQALEGEIKQACQALKNGESEGGVYIRFGNQLGLLPYIRLGGLLSQNLRSGTGELFNFLEREVQESFYERRAQVKQRGEEIGVKLLMPMGILLFLTLGIIIVPAFLQF